MTVIGMNINHRQFYIIFQAWSKDPKFLTMWFKNGRFLYRHVNPKPLKRHFMKQNRVTLSSYKSTYMGLVRVHTGQVQNEGNM